MKAMTKQDFQNKAEEISGVTRLLSDYSDIQLLSLIKVARMLREHELDGDTETIYEKFCEVQEIHRK